MCKGSGNRQKNVTDSMGSILLFHIDIDIDVMSWIAKRLCIPTCFF